MTNDCSNKTVKKVEKDYVGFITARRDTFTCRRYLQHFDDA